MPCRRSAPRRTYNSDFSEGFAARPTLKIVFPKARHVAALSAAQLVLAGACAWGGPHVCDHSLVAR